MEKTFINPPDVYKAPWRFNQAIKVKGAGSLVFLSGIVGYNLDGSLPKDILSQAENTYASLKAIVEAAGGTLQDVVKTNVYVGEEYQIHKDELRDIRAKYFTDDYPATTLLRVAGFFFDHVAVLVAAVARVAAAVDDARATGLPVFGRERHVHRREHGAVATGVHGRGREARGLVVARRGEREGEREG